MVSNGGEHERSSIAASGGLTRYMQISAALDDIAEECRNTLVSSESSITVDQDDERFEVRQVCIGVLRYMEGEGWFRLAQECEFQNQRWPFWTVNDTSRIWCS